MAFVHLHRLDANPSPSDPLLAIQGDRLLARLGNESPLILPTLSEIRALASEPLALGMLDGTPCWSFSVPEAVTAPDGWEFLDTRSLLAAFSPAQMHAVSTARQLHWWLARNRFCGRCGGEMVDVASERARKCPRCAAVHFPTCSPAVIVAVSRGSSLLLAHNRNFAPGLFSLLAGFVDPGETLEQAVAREVREEVGIEVADIAYVSSQPWPFPNSLMVGFRASHAGGEISVDGMEIERAEWYSANNLPTLPRRGTVARFLIEQWIAEKKTNASS